MRFKFHSAYTKGGADTQGKANRLARNFCVAIRLASLRRGEDCVVG